MSNWNNDFHKRTLGSSRFQRWNFNSNSNEDNAIKGIRSNMENIGINECNQVTKTPKDYLKEINTNHLNSDYSQPLDTPGQSGYRSTKRTIKIRRSMLGRRFTKQYAAVQGFKSSDIICSKMNYDCSGSIANNKELKPIHSSSPVYSSCLQTPLGERNHRLKSPQHPFNNSENLDGTAFFETGISNLTTWSVFKTGGVRRGLKSPAMQASINTLTSGRLIESTPNNPVAPSCQIKDNSVVVRKLYDDKPNFDTSNESHNFDLSQAHQSIKSKTKGLINSNTEENNVGDIQEISKHSSIKKNKKLSVVKEESENSPVQIKKCGNTEQTLHKVRTLFSQFNSLRDKCAIKRKELSTIEDEMDRTLKEINNTLKSSTVPSRETYSLEVSSTRNTNKNATEIKENNVNINYSFAVQRPADRNNILKNNFQLDNSTFKSPMPLHKTQLNSTAYTPKTLTFHIEEQMKDLFC